MKRILLVLCSLSLFACKSTKNSVSIQSPMHMSPTIAQIDDAKYQLETARLQIDSVQIDKSLVTIFYSSPIAIAKLELVGSSMLAKSFPPIRNCKLIMLPAAKKGETASGKAIFDVRALSHKFTKDAPTYLQLEGWSEKLLFIYPD